MGRLRAAPDNPDLRRAVGRITLPYDVKYVSTFSFVNISELSPSSLLNDDKLGIDR